MEGKQRTRKWADEKGIDRYITEVIATEMHMLDKKDSRDASSDQPFNDSMPSDDIPPLYDVDYLDHADDET